ncbi:hypothetical protein ACF8R6_05750 [Pseudomonas sp. CJQ_7]|uniref:hypothetical protein n=1 Tax=Pseudomonas sp. CJQ_7 TaxID=3367166 RepID=UPI00370B4417
MLTQEELQQEIQLIFARACAEGLRSEAIRLMQMDSVKDARAFANEYAKAFSSAFVFTSDRFSEGRSAYCETTSAPNGTSEAEPQSSPEDQHQELLSLMRLQAETQERISQLLER